MLNEPSIVSSGQAVKAPPVAPVSIPHDAGADQLRTAVANVMDVVTVDHQPPPPASISYLGRLRVDSETAYAQLDEQFAPLDYHVVLTTNEDNLHVVMAL
jgi:hypothetical protein